MHTRTAEPCAEDGHRSKAAFVLGVAYGDAVCPLGIGRFAADAASIGGEAAGAQRAERVAVGDAGRKSRFATMIAFAHGSAVRGCTSGTPID